MVGRLREDRAVDDVTRVAATARLKLLDVAQNQGTSALVRILISVPRLGDLLDFGQFFKAFGNN